MYFYYLLSCGHIYEDAYELEVGSWVDCEMTTLCGSRSKVLKEYENSDKVEMN